MKFRSITRLTAISGFICGLGLTPAMAQTAPGAMAPIPATAAATAAKPGAKLPKSLTFASLAAATAHCPSDTVVWSSLSKSHSFHMKGSRYYGTTKHGAYVCRGDALAAGFHQAKS